jgi:hypothetical protein
VELSSNPEQLTMSRYQLLFVPLILCPTLLLMGTFGGESPPAPQIAAVTELTQPRADTTALHLLDQASAIYAADKIRWLEMTIWQRVRIDQRHHTVEGRFLAGPDQRARLELTVHVGKTRGAMLVVSDGKTLWQTQRFGANAAESSVLDLPLLDAKTEGPSPVQARLRLLQDHGLIAVTPLLQALRERLQEPTWQKVRWNEREIIRLSGRWPRDAAKLAAVPADFRPSLEADRCSVYFDSDTLWPHRVEWWAARKSNHADTLLAQLEFRNPVLNRALTPEQCAKEFNP